MTKENVFHNAHFNKSLKKSVEKSSWNLDIGSALSTAQTCPEGAGTNTDSSVLNSSPHWLHVAWTTPV